MRQPVNRAVPTWIVTVAVAVTAGLLASCSMTEQGEQTDQPSPRWTRPGHFNPCDDVSKEFRQRNNLTEPTSHYMHYSRHPKAENKEGLECVYTTNQEIADPHSTAYSLSVSISDSFTPGKPDYQTEEFEPIQVAGRRSEIGCVTEGVHQQRPYCDIKVSLNDTEIWFFLQYDYPRENMAASEAATRAKVLDLATQIVAEIPPDK